MSTAWTGPRWLLQNRWENTFARNLTGREEFQAGVGMLADRWPPRLRRHRMKCTGWPSDPGPGLPGSKPPESAGGPHLPGPGDDGNGAGGGLLDHGAAGAGLTVTAIAAHPGRSVRSTLFSGRAWSGPDHGRPPGQIRLVLGMASEPQDAARGGTRLLPLGRGAGRLIPRALGYPARRIR